MAQHQPGSEVAESPSSGSRRPVFHVGVYFIRNAGTAHALTTQCALVASFVLMGVGLYLRVFMFPLTLIRG
jgi:hypothetical protein